MGGHQNRKMKALPLLVLLALAEAHPHHGKVLKHKHDSSADFMKLALSTEEDCFTEEDQVVEGCGHSEPYRVLGGSYGPEKMRDTYAAANEITCDGTDGSMFSWE